MTKKFFWLPTILFLMFVHLAEAQAPKVPRIGFLVNSSASESLTALRIDAFRHGLSELGYVEGKNIVIEYKYADGRFERLPILAEDLVRLKVEIIVADLTTSARAAKKATSTIPIVTTGGSDPIQSGLVTSLARPGGNVTGLTSYTSELLGKRLELLKEVVPKVSRFGFLHDASSEPGASRAAFKETQRPAKSLGVQLQSVEVKAPNPDFGSAFQLIAKERIGALITSPAPLITFHRKRILQLVEQNRIPTMHPSQDWTNVGGLMSYGPNGADLYRRAAVYVDKILKGAKPADLPVEQPMKFEFVINLKSAKALTLTIPQSVLYRADKVIK
jgi:putative ABC transport system substrate-binding protein